MLLEYVEPSGVEYVEPSAWEYVEPSGWDNVTQSLLVECTEPSDCVEPFNLEFVESLRNPSSEGSNRTRPGATEQDFILARSP